LPLPVISAALGIALVSSVAMVLPISTPSNVLVYARGDVTTRELALAGGIVGVIAGVRIGSSVRWLQRLWGVAPRRRSTRVTPKKAR
jgi:sodium-dependent dicarboxylate transporter 2/3/5